MRNPKKPARMPSDRKMLYLSPGKLRESIAEKDWTNREFVRQYRLRRDAAQGQYPRARALDEPAVATFINAAPFTSTARANTQTLALMAAVFGQGPDYFNELTNSKSDINNLPTLIVSPPGPQIDTESLKADVIRIGFPADQPFIDLPRVSVLARAGFVEAGGTLDSYSFHDTRRIYLRGTLSTMYTSRIVFEVDGDSMEPVINSGDEVVCVLVPEGKWDVSQNDVFVVGFGDDMLTIKKIIGNELMNKGTLTLWPWRSELAPLTIRRAQIRSIYRVEEVLPKPFKLRL